MKYEDPQRLVAEDGLLVRGGFHVRPEDDVPPLEDGCSAVTIIMIGNAGPDMWEHYAARPEATLAVDPLDSWSRRVIHRIAERAGGNALFPFTGPPFLPFMRWAMRAEAVHRSPIGPLIHPVYGLWHAYRGAVALSAVMHLPERTDAAPPCQTCSERPCLQTCPVDALSDGDYDVRSCATHVEKDAGRACLDGCLARRACPVGREYFYGPVQAGHHMRSFVASVRRDPETRGR